VERLDGSLGPGPRKKLSEAAAWWVRGGGEYDQARADLRAFGFAEEAIVEQLGPVENDCHLWPDNWAAWCAFLTVQTQWARGGMGEMTGLDYARVRVGLAMAGVKSTPELFSKLRIIESAALNLLNKKDTRVSAK
jgi:Phage related hypothetical protein (DUF1799)